MDPLRWEREGWVISTDPALLAVDRIHAFLTQSYWARGIPLALVEKSIQHSLCFGLYRVEGVVLRQMGFARVVSDHATFAYLGDVYVEAAWRGQGLSKWLMACIVAHPELQGLRRFCLGTRDAHGLYAQYGFEVIGQPQNWMEIRVPDPYGPVPAGA